MPTESQNLVYIQLKSVEQNCLPGLWSVSKVLMLGRKRHHWPEPKVANSIREHLAEHCWKWESRRKVEGGWNQGWVIHCDGCMLLLIRVFPDTRWAASACLARPPSFFSSFKQFSIKSIQTHVYVYPPGFAHPFALFQRCQPSETRWSTNAVRSLIWTSRTQSRCGGGRCTTSATSSSPASSSLPWLCLASPCPRTLGRSFL